MNVFLYFPLDESAKSHGWRACVLTCLVCLRAWRAKVLTGLPCTRAYVFTYLAYLRVLYPYVLTCLTCLLFSNILRVTCYVFLWHRLSCFTFEKSNSENSYIDNFFLRSFLRRKLTPKNLPRKDSITDFRLIF